MKLTRTTGYAVSALSYISRHPGVNAVPAKEISRKNHIPMEYLLKVLAQLVRSGILHSLRGPHGGYMLVLPAQELTLANIVEAIEGEMSGDIGEFPSDADAVVAAGLERIYRKANRVVIEMFSQTSLAELAGI